MNKFQNWVKGVVFFLISSIVFYVNGEGKRFDFEIHKEHFLNSEYSISSKRGTYSQENEITFKDGCAVKFNTDLQTGQAFNWRWSNREEHGKIM